MPLMIGMAIAITLVLEGIKHLLPPRFLDDASFVNPMELLVIWVLFIKVFLVSFEFDFAIVIK